jgi:hypothetical protein
MVATFLRWRGPAASIRGQRHSHATVHKAEPLKPGCFLMIRHILIPLRVFALFLFAFSPSMILLVAVAFLTKSTWWFSFVGVPALFGNGVLILMNPWRSFIGAHLRTIAARR